MLVEWQATLETLQPLPRESVAADQALRNVTPAQVVGAAREVMGIS